MCGRFAAAVGMLFLGSGWALEKAPVARVEAEPNPALMDERVVIRVSGFAPGASVAIAASSQDQAGVWWRSSAMFVAGQDGTVDTSVSAAIRGSYSGVDAMGLFWSMRPDRREYPFFKIVDWFRPVVTDVEVRAGGVVWGRVKVVRRFAAEGVRADPVRRGNVVGVFYRSGNEGCRPGVILLGGSEGGFPEPDGAMLASRGFAVLALAYFGVQTLPRSMQKIPLEYFGEAIRLMPQLPGVCEGGVVLVGGSRGAEAALLAASLYPEVSGAVGSSGSNVRWEGATEGGLPGGAAWTWEKTAPDYVPFHIGAGFGVRYLWAKAMGHGISLRPMFEDSLGREKRQTVEIAVERIRGPVLLGSGTLDRKWPSGPMSTRAVERLQRWRHGYGDEHLAFPGAGHWLPLAYLPTGGLEGAMAEEIGGTPQGTAEVERLWWPRVLQFLRACGRYRAALRP